MKSNAKFNREVLIYSKCDYYNTRHFAYSCWFFKELQASKAARMIEIIRYTFGDARLL